MVNVVTPWMLVDKIFKISLCPVASFELVLSNLCLWLMLWVNQQTLYSDYVAAIQQMIIAYYH